MSQEKVLKIDILKGKNTKLKLSNTYSIKR